MRIIISLLAFLFAYTSFAQNNSFDSLLEKGKEHFNNAKKDSDYDSAIYYFDAATKLKPNNQEAWYYLGYAYSRSNMFDGNEMINVTVEKTKLSSNAFEQVIKIDSIYKGEMLILDPYSKIGSEWSSLALKYIYYNDIDSAKWAFQQARKLNIYSDFILEYNRYLLSSCSKDAILLVTGDIITFPLLYLQYTEDYRTDVTVIDVGLLGTSWYTQHLVNNNKINLNYTPEELNTIQYKKWQEQSITIANIQTKNDFTWTMKPTYADKYVLRNDLILLDILKKNKFERDVFYYSGTSNESDYNLNFSDNNYENYFLIRKVTNSNTKSLNQSTKLLNQFDFSQLQFQDFSKTTQSQTLLLSLRIQYLIVINDYINNDKISEAKKLYARFKQKLSEQIYPYSKTTKKVIIFIEERLK